MYFRCLALFYSLPTIMHIIGDWFIIRDLRLDDIPRLAEIGNNYKIWINLSHTFPHPYTLADAERWVNHNLSLGDKTESFAVEIDGQFAGGCGVRHKWWDQAKTRDVWYRLGEEYRGRWLASKICKTITDYGFTTHDAERIEWSVFWRNPPSMKVLEKCGYTREGVQRNRIWKDGKITDEVLFGILKSEWKSLQK